jgi:hypothetical protein
MSSDLIEKLQGESQQQKVEIEILKKKIDRQQKQYFEMLQLKNTEAIKCQVQSEVKRELEKHHQGSFAPKTET